MFKTLRPPVPSRTTPLRILIVDDQRFDREKILRCCKGLDRPFQITDAPTLARVADLVGNRKFDLIVLDYSLPDGTGLDALDMIRLSSKNCTAAVIMVTGQGMEGLAEEALRGGCADYLVKADLTRASFTRAVANAMEKSDLTKSAAVQTLKRQEVEAVLQRFSRDCAQEIKPMVSRLMRQLRALPSPDNHTAMQFEDMEQSCMRLWEFLVELETHQGAELASEICDTSPPVKDTASGARPSLFGRA